MPAVRSVLVIGATGVLGRPVTRQLVEAGFAVSAMVRDVARARAMLPAAVRLVEGDVRDRSSLDRALEGADAVYLNLSNRMVGRRPKWDPDADGTLDVLDAAQRQGVRRFARISAMGVEEGADVWWVARVKRDVDEAILSSGLDATIFRPTWLMESIPMSVAGPFLLGLPDVGAPLYWLAADDFGRQVAAALDRYGGVDPIVLSQGPEAIPMREAFRRFRRIWRRSLLPMPMSRGVIALCGRVVPPMAYLDGLFRMTARYADKVPAEVNGHALHRPAMTLEEYARGLLTARDFPRR